MVNLSLNQTLMRSLNTSITALLPMLSLLVVGSFILGATTLQEFALALLIGLASGAYSSIFIASPLLALLKEREPRYQRRPPADRGPRCASAGAAVAGPSRGPGDDDDVVDDRRPWRRRSGPAGRHRAAPPATPPAPIPPRPRKKTKRR